MVVVNWTPVYAFIRTTAWWVVWAVVHLDAFLNRRSRGRGWRLQRCILVLLTIQCISETIHAIVVRKYDDDNVTYDPSKSVLFKVELVFDQIASSMFLCVILLVSAGYCILRDHLGDHKLKVIAIPIVYGITNLGMDIILLASVNSEIVTQTGAADTSDEEDIDSENIKSLVLVICSLIKAVVFVSAWVFVFEQLGWEIRHLRGEKVQAVVQSDEDESGAYSRPNLQDRVEARTGHDVEAGEDHPKTVEEAVGDQAKLLLLTRFRTILIIYVVSVILVNILPFFLENTSVETVQSVILVLENILGIAFVSSLAYIFRPVGDNPYLSLMDEENLENDEPMEVSTELGVLSLEPSTPQQASTTLSNIQKMSYNENATFALEDEDDPDLLSPKKQSSENATPMASVTHEFSSQWKNEDEDK